MELVARDLACARGGVPVLERLNFKLAGGRALILRGPNGSGKTTLLRTLAGLQPPHSGSVTVPPEAIAYAGHADGIKASLTVAENLAFWAAVFARPGIGEALAAFDLTVLRDRPAGFLSAGQKRRLGLARMAVTGRPIWLLDEPTVSLDTDAVARFAAVIGNHLSTGGSAILATHIDLGLTDADTLDVGPYRAASGAGWGADAADPFAGAFA